MFGKLDFDTIYYAYLNESPFKYYTVIFGGVEGLRPGLFRLFRGGGVQNSGKPAYIILARSPITKMQMTPKLKTTLKLKMVKKNGDDTKYDNKDMENGLVFRQQIETLFSLF